MKKGITVIFLIILCNITSVSAFEDGYDYEDTFRYYDWLGDSPNFVFGYENYSYVEDNVITIKWNWWDNYSAGNGYVVHFLSTFVNNDTIINETDVRYWMEESSYVNFGRAKFLHISALPTEITIEVDNTTKEGDLLVFDFYLMYYVGGTHQTVTTFEYIESRLILTFGKKPTGIQFELSYLPIVIGGGVLSIVSFIIFISKKDKQKEVELLQ